MDPKLKAKTKGTLHPSAPSGPGFVCQGHFAMRCIKTRRCSGLCLPLGAGGILAATQGAGGLPLQGPRGLGPHPLHP